MKVCLVSRYFDFRNAGLGRVGTEIMSGLIRRGHSVRTVSTNGNSLYSYFFYTLAEIPFRLPRDVDVYHAITPMEGMWLPKRKSVVTFHDLIQMLSPEKLGSGMGYSRWKRFIGMHYNKFVINRSKNCARVTAVSEETGSNVIKYLGVPESKVTVITSGIRPDLQPLRPRDGVARIGYLGQLDKRKRVDLLIKAFKESLLKSELIIAGTGLDEPILRELAKGDNRIKFVGRVPDRELVDYYNSLDVFVFPTIAEGYGLPIVEAMACKRPVVVLGDADIPNNVKSRCVIVEDLEVLFSNEKYFRDRCEYNDYEGNYEWAKSHDWDKAVGKYIKLYEEILSE